MWNGIIDFKAMSERVDGDVDLLQEIIKIFLSRYPNVVARIGQAITAADSKSLEAEAHNLRGYLVSLHAKRSSEVVLELEMKGRLNDFLGAGEIFSKLKRELELLNPLLTKTLTNP